MQTNTAGSIHMAGDATNSMLHGEIVLFLSQMGLVVHGTMDLWRNDVEVKNFENTDNEEKRCCVARYDSAVEVGYYDNELQRARSPMIPKNEACVVSEAYLYNLRRKRRKK